MNFGKLQTEVQLLMQDWSDDIVSAIPGAINEAQAFVAGEVDIPDLKLVTSIDTVVDQAYATMPGQDPTHRFHPRNRPSPGKQGRHHA